MKICCEIQLIIYPFVFWIKLNVEIIEEPLTEQEIKKEAKEKSKKQSSEVIFKKHFELSMHPFILNHRRVIYERFFSILAIFMTIFGRFKKINFGDLSTIPFCRFKWYLFLLRTQKIASIFTKKNNLGYHKGKGYRL